MNGIAARACCEVVGAATRRAGVRHQRQDHHHPAARRGAPRHGDHGHHQLHRREPHLRHRARARARARRPASPVLEVDERVAPAVVDPLDAELLVLGNLSRDQLDRYGEVHAVGGPWRAVRRDAPGVRIVANASDPHVVWAGRPANPPGSRSVSPWRQRRRDVPALRGAARRGRPTGSTAPSCGFAQPETTNRLDGDVLVLDGERIPLDLALPGAGTSPTPRSRLPRPCALRGPDRSRRGRARDRSQVVAGRTFSIRRLARRARAACSSPRTRRAGPRCCAAAGSTTAVVIAVNARVADGKDPSWLWDVPYELLRGRAGRRPPASDPRRRGTPRYADVEHAAWSPTRWARPASLPATTVHIVASYTQFSALCTHSAVRVMPADVRGPRRPRATPSSSAPTATAATRLVLVAARPSAAASTPSSSRLTAATPIPDSLDIYLFGGGEDDPQLMAAGHARAPAAIDGRVARAGVFAVCAGFQLIGHRYDAGDGAARRPRARRRGHRGRPGPADRRGRGGTGPEPRARRTCSPASRTTAVAPPSGRAASRSARCDRRRQRGRRRSTACCATGSSARTSTDPCCRATRRSRTCCSLGRRAELAPLDDVLVEQLRAERLEAASATSSRAHVRDLRLTRG